ncbi:MAG: DUF348 domain-containing protein [Clostridiales bacterium]|nr:DUF348 domain-containing protein [Clostridiales bacterium]
MEPQQRNMRIYKLLCYVCIVLALVGGTTTGFTRYVQGAYNEVTLNDNGYTVQIQTMDKTVKELLDRYEINLGPGDEITPGLEEAIEEDTEINIRRAFKVTVEADGKFKTVYLTEGTVEDALKEAYIVVKEKDLLNYPLNQQVLPGDHIKVIRVKEEILIEKENIPYRLVTKENKKLEKGKQELVQEGKEGVKEREILIAYHDGVEVNREIVEERVSVVPVDRIIAKGTYVAPPVSRGDSKREKVTTNKTTKEKTNKKKTEEKKTTKSKTTNTNTSKKKTESKTTRLSSGTYTFQATAYTRTGNKTRSGKWPKKGMIAVDKRLIPLGTKVYVEFPGKWAHMSGYYTAEDTGGAIKGKIIDVFMDTDDSSQAARFGRVRNVKVTIP